jgi:hypothetical protein
MDIRPSREELRGRLRGLRTAVIWGSGIAFVAALGLVATNPQGTQAATGATSPSSDTGDTASSPVSPVTNAPNNQPPILHSRRS